MKAAITDHAREQFCARVEDCRPADVDARIRELFARSSRLRERGSNNAERWRLDDPLVEFLVKRERGEAVIVTVIGAKEIERPALTAEEVLAALGPVKEPEPETLPKPKTPKVKTPGSGRIVILIDWHAQDVETAKQALLQWARHVARPRPIVGAFIASSSVRLANQGAGQ